MKLPWESTGKIKIKFGCYIGTLKSLKIYGTLIFDIKSQYFFRIEKLHSQWHEGLEQLSLNFL